MENKYKIKEINSISKSDWDRFVYYPTQSFSWSISRQKNGNEILKIGIYEDDILISNVLIILKKIPFLNKKIAYIFKGEIYNESVYKELVSFGLKKNIIAYIFEPNFSDKSNIPKILTYKKDKGEFATWTPYLNLSESYEDLEKKFSKVVRNESKYAIKSGVIVECGVSDKMFSEFLYLTEKTSKRNKFLGYKENYYKNVFDSLKGEGEALLFNVYDNNKKCVASSIVFDFKDTLYYMYAGSLGKETPKGAMYLLLTEIIKYGQKNNKKLLDLFGSLSPEGKGKKSWVGFSNFKKSFGPYYKEYVGRYDLIISTFYYKIFGLISFIKKILTFIVKKIS
jgi:peptidoglycan pentaglycine glycine transferase (the first glycine)